MYSLVSEKIEANNLRRGLHEKDLAGLLTKENLIV